MYFFIFLIGLKINPYRIEIKRQRNSKKGWKVGRSKKDCFVYFDEWIILISSFPETHQSISHPANPGVCLPSLSNLLNLAIPELGLLYFRFGSAKTFQNRS
jgi:hypothetical protein